MIAKFRRGIVRRAALDSTHDFDRTDGIEARRYDSDDAIWCRRPGASSPPTGSGALKSVGDRFFRAKSAQNIGKYQAAE